MEAEPLLLPQVESDGDRGSLRTRGAGAPSAQSPPLVSHQRTGGKPVHAVRLEVKCDWTS